MGISELSYDLHGHCDSGCHICTAVNRLLLPVSKCIGGRLAGVRIHHCRISNIIRCVY